MEKARSAPSLFHRSCRIGGLCHFRFLRTTINKIRSLILIFMWHLPNGEAAFRSGPAPERCLWFSRGEWCSLLRDLSAWASPGDPISRLSSYLRQGDNPV